MRKDLTPVPGGSVPQLDDTGREVVRVKTCGVCGRSWNDAVASALTPTPAGRCPFEHDHTYQTEGETMGIHAQRSTVDLANTADVAEPDTPESPGAHFLRTIAEEVDDMLADPNLTDDELTDAIEERADAIVPVYTAELWAVFVDLAAYREDDETGAMAEYVSSGPAGMSWAAGFALYQIARRLMETLIAESQEDDDE